MRNRVKKGFLLGAGGLLLAAVPAMAQFPGDTPDNFRMRLGGIFANFDTNIKLSSPTLPGTEVDFTGLGLTEDHKTTFRGEAYWNFAGRSYLDFGYVNYDVSGSHTISRDIAVDGVIYKAGATVDGQTRSQYIYAAYRYGIVNNSNVHLGLSLGVTYTKQFAKLSATANVTRPDGSVIVGGATKEREISVPVPLLGVSFEVKVAGPVTVGARVRAIGATVDPWSGSWVEGAAEVNWFISRNFGLGAAYEYQKLIIEKESEGNLFRYDQRYDGPRAYLLITF